MFRIRQIYDTTAPINRRAVEQVQGIFKEQLPGLAQKESAALISKMRNPIKYRFRFILFVAEGLRGKVLGFALMSHEPDLKFCFLDHIASAKRLVGKGIGGALYGRVRKEAAELGSIGLFFESLPDDPRLSRDPVIRRQNAARLRFYESFGARPVANTAYETPLKPDGDNPPYLMFDDLGKGTSLPRETARNIVRTILERKYPRLTAREYIEKVVNSFQDDPVRLRQPKHPMPLPVAVERSVSFDRQIIMTVNAKHRIHHVVERGYVEAPVRVRSILDRIEKTGLFRQVPMQHFGEKYIKAVHDAGFVDYFRRVCAALEPDETIYPYVFPIRNKTRPPRSLPIRAGYYCIDTFTPINRNAYLAAKGAVDCTLTCARAILKGERIAYALVRPPGHHAEREVFGGFCYFNSAAIAAHYLSAYGNVAMLDIDHHHGNGTQDIFYARSYVLTISIHGMPSTTFPYFSGFKAEKGEGDGEGFNVNVPLPDNIDGARYLKVLRKMVGRIKRFRPDYLIIPLGLDTGRDPTSSWNLTPNDFKNNGRLIGSLKLPTLITQEGGYDNRVLGVNARNFFFGLWEGYYGALR